MTALPAGPLLFDTGVYIRFSRGENYLWLGEDARVFQRTILTAVVAAELYAGTHDHREKRVLRAECLRANGFRPPLSRSADRAGSCAGWGHTRDRECQRFRALEISPCLYQEDSETI